MNTPSTIGSWFNVRPGVWILRILWLLVTAFVVLELIQGMFPKEERPLEWFTDDKIDFLQRWIVLVFVIFFFLLVPRAFSAIAARRQAEVARSEADQAAGGFPNAGSDVVAVLLLAITALSIIGLALTFNPPDWPGHLSFLDVKDPELRNRFNEALLMVFGAGIGSSIATIMAFNRHASALRDFHPSWAPWYVSRPLMGMLLGLVFYFLIRGGLLVTAATEVKDLNPWSLAAIGALVGLFSRNAIGKLREVFQTMFRTESELRMKLADLAGDVRERFLQVLPDEARLQLVLGSEEKFRSVLQGLSPTLKNKTLNECPQSLVPILKPLLQFTDGDLLIDQLKALSQDDLSILTEKLQPGDAALIMAEKGDELLKRLKNLDDVQKMALLEHDKLSKAAKGILKPILADEQVEEPA